MRVDFHPDQFNVINSVKDKVVKDTIRNLNHAVDLYDLMEYDEGKLSNSCRKFSWREKKKVLKGL